MSDSVKRVSVLQFSPHNENCGVGKYQENFMGEYGRGQLEDIQTDFFDASPYQTRVMTQSELDGVLTRLREKLAGYDILHIQHEFGLFTGDEFAQIVDAAASLGKKIVVTVHLSPALAFKSQPREGIGPRSLIHVARQKRLHGIFKQRHIEAFHKADLLITHNDGATRSLESYGIDRSHILQFFHPVLGEIKTDIVSTELSESLNKQPGDVLYATVGYMHRYKGTEDAVRALKFLPSNYKLAIIGGTQPVSEDGNLYNKIATLVDALGLHERVYITGYVEDDARMNALIREADICVYPYDNTYYGQVSSGALNLSFANDRPVIAYPTDSFKECNQEFHQIVMTNAFAYYELAREIKRLDTEKQRAAIRLYADKYSWRNTAEVVAGAYRELVGGRA